MLKRFLYINLLNLFLLVISSLYVYATTGRESTKECSICHYEWLDVFMHQMKSTEIAKLPKNRVVAEERMCFSCHDGSVVDSRIKVWANDMHKVGVKPPVNMTIPNELPLSADNRIECKTCHTAHGTGDPKKEGMERSVFLRVPNENGELCKLCHKDKIGIGNHPEKIAKEHLNNELMVLGKKNKVMCMSCHAPHGSKNSKILIDPVNDSRICGDCHLEKVKNGEYVKGVMNHPVNVKVNNDMLMEIERSNLSLVNGKIVCNTCHKPHKAKDDKLLAMSNKNDELCFVCHYEKRQVYYTNHNLTKKQNLDLSIFKDKPAAVCNVCHKPHGWNINYETNNSDPFSNVCLSCHLNSTIVGNKILDINKKFNHPVMKFVTDNLSLPLYEYNTKNIVMGVNKKKQNGYITCFTCHDTHSKNKYFLRMELKNNALCLDCHKDKKNIANTKHFSNDMTCVSCHKIHNSDFKNLLKSPDNGCFECHKESGLAYNKLIGMNTHPVNQIPKVKIKQNYKLENGKIVCITCHNPHEKGSDGKFLRYNKLKLCIDCHEDKKEILDTKHDLSSKENDFCQQCHSVHNAKSPIKLFTYKINEKRELCISCHSEKGLVKKTSPQMIHTDKNLYQIPTSFKSSTIDCIDCHDPHKNGPKKNNKNIFKLSFLKHKEESIVCFNCHENKTNFINSKHNMLTLQRDLKRFGVSKDDGDLCGFCHSIHSYKNIAIKGIKNQYICENCHRNSEVVDKKAIYTSHEFVNLEKFKGYSAKNNKMNCTTCHDPHESSSKMIIKKKKSNELCSECHLEQSYALYSPHNKNLPRIDSFVCGDCHQPHNYPKNNRYMWKDTQNSSDFIEEVCFYCHSKSGVANNRVVEHYTHPDLPMTYKIDKAIKPFLYTRAGEKSYSGRITCSTCHDSHVWSEKEHLKKNLDKKEGDALTSFLKYKHVLEFCNTCHGGEGLLRYKYYHTDRYRKKVDMPKQGEIKKSIDLKEKLIRMLLGDGELIK